MIAQQTLFFAPNKAKLSLEQLALSHVLSHDGSKLLSDNG
jgi:hypothetical protein